MGQPITCSACGQTVPFEGSDGFRCSRCLAAASAPPSDAQRLALEAHRQAQRSQGAKWMWIGGILCVVGTVVTVATLAAAENGGTYFVWWGAIIFGAVRFFRGLSIYRSA